MQYQIWLDRKWTNIDHSMAHSKLGEHFATFDPISTMFMDINLAQSRGPRTICAFVVNDQGDKIYADRDHVIKLDRSPTDWIYCIKPSDFMGLEATIAIEKALGNPLAQELDK